MGWPDSPADLLAGPRGRRLCFQLSGMYGDRAGLADGCPAWFDVMFGPGEADRHLLAAELAAVVERLGLAALAGTAEESALLGPLAETVAHARYWQQPDEVDAVLADGLVAASLAPVAAAVTAAPAAGWWASPQQRDRQVFVQFLGARNVPDFEPPDLTRNSARLASWRAKTAWNERNSVGERPGESGVNHTGNWWSTPALSGLVVTTRPLPRLGAARLLLVEDPLGWTAARCWPLRPAPDARVYEVSGPDSWVALVERYPLEVTMSRRHDWWRATGWTGRWLIPDYAALAADFDGVHVTVGGYLTTAGRALPAGHASQSAACTMLAGWDPDATIWLTDVLSAGGHPARWLAARDAAPLGWIESAGEGS